MSHTPGPWRVIYFPSTDGAERIMASANTEIVCGAFRGQPISVQNAYLIAAAPDLLEALEGLVRIASLHSDEYSFEPELSAANAAIAKAKETP